MRVEKDFEELLKYFNKHKVRYCIVGGFAVGFHGMPRYTKDMDILVEPAVENGERIIQAIKDFGFESLGLTKEDFNNKKQIVQLGQEPGRIDVITSIPGCSFKEIWANKKSGEYGLEKVYFIGFQDLMKNKKSAARPQDRVDVEKLEAIRKKKRRSKRKS